MALSNKKTLLIIDGQGGKIGRLLVEAASSAFPDIDIIAVGTNSMATANMIKGGARNAATGENAVIVNSRTADIIVGPLAIVIADSLLGEITSAMASAVGQSGAYKVLIPVNKCNNVVVGTGGQGMSELIQQALELIREKLN